MEQSVEIFDNDIPVFGPDLTPALGTTGDRFTIEINVTDNIDVSVVVLAYWFGSGQENVTTIWNPSGVIYVNITLPSDSLDILHYKFSVADKAGNFNDTPVRNVTIIDNDIPVFGSLIAEESSTTGDTYYLVQGIDDNIELDSVWIEYWFGEGDHENVSMTGDGPYTYLIAIPSNFTDTLHYIIHANDTSDNWNETSVRDVVILDDDNPYFAPYSIPSTLGTGQVLHVPIRAYDNVGIHAMYFEYWFGSGSHTNLTLGGSGDAILEQQIPEDSVDPFHYIVSVVDTNGNWSSFYGSIVIVDIIDPVAKCGKNITVEEDAPLTLNASGSSDNIGIVNLSWTFNVDSDVVVIYGWSPVYAFSQPGSYDILMNVTDEAGNWETDTINVIVTDITDPVIVIEPMEVNEDTSIIFDGSECTDNVGIENISYSFEDGDKDVILYGIAPGYVFSAPGIYDITLALSDEAGNKVSTVFRVTVRDVTKPTIEAGADRTVPEGTIVTLDATGSDNVGIVNWTLGTGSADRP